MIWTTLRMRWPRMTRNFLLPTVVSVHAAAAAIALAESIQKAYNISETKNPTDLSGRSNEDLARPDLLTLIDD